MIDPTQMKDRTYIYVMITGTPSIIEFNWNKKRSYEENKIEMRHAIIDQVLWPVSELESCDQINDLVAE